MVVLPYAMARPLIEEFKQGNREAPPLPPSIKRKLERSRRNVEFSQKITNKPKTPVSENNDNYKTEDTFFTPMHSPSQLETPSSKRLSQQLSELSTMELELPTTPRASTPSHPSEKSKAISDLKRKLLNIHAISPGGHLHRFKRKDTIKKADIDCLLNYAFDEGASRPVGSAAFIDWVRASGFSSAQFSEHFKKQLQTVPSSKPPSQVGRGWIFLK